MTTKKDAAMQAMIIARQLRALETGDEEIEDAVQRLLWLARDLYPAIDDHPWYAKLAYGDEPQTGTIAKLRQLIEHPETGSHERDNAVRRLARLRATRETGGR